MPYALLLIRLLTAHILGDFFLQPTKWVESKKTKSFRSPYQYIHAFVHAVLAYLLVAQWDNVWIPFWIFISHLTIDLIKSRFSNNLWSFVLDQAAHVSVIGIIALSNTQSFHSFYAQLWVFFQNENLWLVLSGYLIITKPVGLIIQFFTQKWQEEWSEKPNEGSLKNAGKWIGYLERILTLTFILVGQFSAIGFLIAAKSIFRFGDLTNAKERKMTEYILIGTLLSFSTAILLGVLILKWIE
jgi:hypothetical protein